MVTTGNRQRRCTAGLLVMSASLAFARACCADGVAASPVGGGDSIRLEPVAVPAPLRTQRPVYVCHDVTPVIFSDRPCGPAVERRTLEVVAAGPGRTATTVPAAPSAATRPRARPGPEDRVPPSRDDRCKRLREQLEKLDDRMRSGYSAREAARLWNRWREAKARLRDAHC